MGWGGELSPKETAEPGCGLSAKVVALKVVTLKLMDPKGGAWGT